MALRVMLADDSALFRAGLAGLLRSGGVDVAAIAATGEELERMVASDAPDAVILDIRMPPGFRDEGIDTALRLRKAYRDISVLVLSTYAEPDHAIRLFKDGNAGIGYLLKDRVDDLAALLEALRRLRAGESVVDHDLITRLMQRAQVRDALAALTSRELDVLRLMAEGRSNAGISGELYLSQKTVETHAASVFLKLGLYASSADNRRVLAVVAYLKGQLG